MVVVAAFVLSILNIQIGVCSDGDSLTDMASLGQQASAANAASECFFLTSTSGGYGCIPYNLCNCNP